MHGALFLNQKCKIEPEQIDLWVDTHLFIIDEISFVSKSDFQMMHKQLGKLKQEINKKFRIFCWIIQIAGIHSHFKPCHLFSSIRIGFSEL